MVTYNVRIGTKDFSSVAEADRYYHAILHSTDSGDEVPFRNAREILSLALLDGGNNMLLGKNFCNVVSVHVNTNRFGRKIFCIQLESGVTLTLSLSRIISAVRKNAAKARIKKAKENGIAIPKVRRKQVHLSPQQLEEMHRIQFRHACRKLVSSSLVKPRLEGLEAHHANPGGFEFILNSFLVLNEIDFQKEVASKGIIRDCELRKKFLDYHNRLVEWEMIDPETHRTIHHLNEPKKKKN